MTSLVVLSLPPNAAADSQGKPQEWLNDWLETHIGAKHGIDSVSLPDFKIGTLDNLVHQSEEVAKLDQQLQGIVNKVHEIITGIHSSKAEAVARAELVEGRAAWEYLQRFSWNSGKYRTDKPISQLLELISTEAFSADTDLRQRYAAYTAAKSNLATLERKQTGDLTVRSLDRLVTKRDVVLDSEYLQSILVVVSASQHDNFLSTYESVSPMVVPKSARKITADKDYVLYSVTVFRKYADEFVNKARESKWVVRELDFSESMAADADAEVKTASEQEKRLFGEMTRLASAAFDDVIKAWGHVRTLRVFVESVLRYGLPPVFITAVFVPTKSVDKTESVLVSKFGYLAGSAMARDKQGRIKEDDLGEYGALVEHDYKPFVIYVSEIP